MSKVELREPDQLAAGRNFKVVKSNGLIQSSRFNLSLEEQKIIFYLISRIKPADIELKEQVFEIREFCRICGMDGHSGANYQYLRRTLKNLRDKSVWMKLEDGSERTLSWISAVTISEHSGTVALKLDDMMKPHLLLLKEQFTQFELLYTLAMRSRYSMRMYELLKSYEYQRQHAFGIDELKKSLSAEKYSRFPDFRRNVLDVAVKEINGLSDIRVAYRIEKEGRRYSKLLFSIELERDVGERLRTWARINGALDS
jgi:plasmid replication initiation protein